MHVRSGEGGGGDRGGEEEDANAVKRDERARRANGQRCSENRPANGGKVLTTNETAAGSMSSFFFEICPSDKSNIRNDRCVTHRHRRALATRLFSLYFVCDTLSFPLPCANPFDFFFFRFAPQINPTSATIAALSTCTDARLFLFIFSDTSSFPLTCVDPLCILCMPPGLPLR